ncbi:MAG: phytoene/squalene synthase family protein [Hydrogenophaga sp.]|uniref:phytoene/squalene synthase family protein n=1 Tax=Hydrogenophaga sp. TaxID=1904254 RepID=UPI00257C8651|nr:phytoene/squalene synthase family protein [Hydrogenophaga sp.]MBL0943657.1 phytoene/squalene synthase family protein [Hydrogenophaga sp.]
MSAFRGAGAPVQEDWDSATLAACRAALRTGSRSFHLASRVLPVRVRAPASALYAFCRAADDAVDQGDDPASAVAALRARLGRVYEAPLRGTEGLALPERALAAVVHRHGIPRALPEALIEGFEWDAQGRRYDSLEALCDYAARVAGAVGAMMALLMGVRSRAALARACELGVAMQLSNIARDVAEDAALGRLYLPQDWLREAGIAPDAWLRAPHAGPALHAVVARLLAVADGLYARAAAGVSQLPLDCRPGINAARLLYAAIGHEVLRRGPQAALQRAVVPRWRQGWLLGEACWRLQPSAAALDAPPLAAVRGLVDAVPLPAREPPAGAERLLLLFERLERGERREALRALPPRAARRVSP